MDPVLYHAHHSLHVEDLPFWQRLAAAQGGLVLELGCGTGRVLQPLAVEGNFMVGLDWDAEMLAYLRRQLSDATKVRLVLSDLRRFAFALRFPLIILPCNTMNILSATDRAALYHCVFNHLAPDGWFVASIPNPAVLAELPAVGEPTVEEVFLHPADHKPVQVSSAWVRDADRVIITWSYDQLQADGSVDRMTMVQSHDTTPVLTLMAELKGAGFKLGETYGDYDRSSYTIDSPFWIFVAHRTD